MKYTVTVIADVLQTEKRSMTVIADDEKQVRDKIRNYYCDVFDCAFNGDKENIYEPGDDKFEKIQHMDVEAIKIHPESMPEKVVIEQMEDDLYHIYNEAGQIIEADFDSYEEAKQYANDNNFIVVNSFHI